MNRKFQRDSARVGRAGVVMAALLALAGCGGGDGSDETTATAESAEATSRPLSVPQETSSTSAGALFVASSLPSSLVRAFLANHDAVRAGKASGIEVSPLPNPPLSALNWSYGSAVIAQSWADQCKWSHNPNRSPDGVWRGENLFASTNTTVGTNTAAQAVRAWGGEYANYTYATNSCAPGKSCGHYKQVMARATKSIGCAVKVCAAGEGTPPAGWEDKPWLIAVCDYEGPYGSPIY